MRPHSQQRPHKVPVRGPPGRLGIIPPLTPSALRAPLSLPPPPSGAMILLAHPYFLRDDAKQLARMKPYPPLATLLAAAVLREQGHDVSLFDAMLADGVDQFRAALAATRPSVVAIVEDSFNYITKMCTTRLRDAT